MHAYFSGFLLYPSSVFQEDTWVVKEGCVSLCVRGELSGFHAVFLCRLPRQDRCSHSHSVPRHHAGILCQRQPLCPPVLRSTFCRALFSTLVLLQGQDLHVLQALVAITHWLSPHRAPLRFPSIPTTMDRSLMLTM